MVKVYLDYALWGNQSTKETKTFSDMNSFVDWFLNCGNGCSTYSMTVGKNKRHWIVRDWHDGFSSKDTKSEKTWIRKDIRCNGIFGAPYLVDIMRVDVNNKTAFLHESKEFGITENYCSDYMYDNFGKIIIDKETESSTYEKMD